MCWTGPRLALLRSTPTYSELISQGDFVKALIVIGCAFLFASTGCAAEDCVAPKSLIAFTTRQLSPEVFLKVSANMKTSDIFAILGPAARDVGSGLYVFEWDANDGRVFSVSTQDICAKPMSLGFHEIVKTERRLGK